MRYTHEELEKLADKAWKFADKLMQSDDEYAEKLGLEITTVAKVLDAVTGRYNWELLDLVKEAKL